MSDRDFLLDTSVLLHYARRTSVCEAIEHRLHLKVSPYSPMICTASLGEIWAIARRQAWNEARTGALETFLRHLVAVDISGPEVISAYADICVDAADNNWGILQKQNALWAAAAARATGATLLTMDSHFDPLCPKHVHRMLFDAKTGDLLKE